MPAEKQSSQPMYGEVRVVLVIAKDGTKLAIGILRSEAGRFQALRALSAM